MKFILIFSCFLFNFTQGQDKATTPAVKIILSVDSIIKHNKSDDEITFKYIVENDSNHSINFFNLSVSYFVADDSGNPLGIGVSLTIEDSTPAYLYAITHTKDFTPSNNYCGFNEFEKIPLTKQDTLNHIITIEPGDFYISRFKLYGCDAESEGKKEIAPTYKYYSEEKDKKKVRIKLIYDDTPLSSGMLYGKKIWIGYLESDWITE